MSKHNCCQHIRRNEECCDTPYYHYNKCDNNCCIPGPRGVTGPQGLTGPTGPNIAFIIIGTTSHNTFVGFQSGISITTGTDNSGFGTSALQNVTSGFANSAFGAFSQQNTTTGFGNTSSGHSSLATLTTGISNTSDGESALAALQTGNNNTASGRASQVSNISGDENTSYGSNSLAGILSGSRNIALGSQAGAGHTLNDSDNIDIGNVGIPGTSGQIRIGTPGIQDETFIAGIFQTGPIANSTNVLVNALGQLSIIPSTRKSKEDIQNMENKSSIIYKLQPRVYKYKTDENHKEHMGLVGEEVFELIGEEITDFIVRDQDNEISTLNYDKLIAPLLNEVIKQKEEINNLHKMIEEQNAQLSLIKSTLLNL